MSYINSLNRNFFDIFQVYHTWNNHYYSYDIFHCIIYLILKTHIQLDKYHQQQTIVEICQILIIPRHSRLISVITIW